ncbi:MAG: amidohydrolase [Clostridiales bacterium]|nr:amidohydrolase [Clostridiales bacterium]
MEIEKDIYVLNRYMKEHRKWFHMHPELGFEVTKTREYIIKELTTVGVDDICVFAGGVRGIIFAQKEAPTLAFRADMDALELEEKTGLEYKSTIKGRMHACGHDGHMSMLLGLAKWAVTNKERLNYNIMLIFQPAEESIGGALPMIEEGVLENPRPESIFAFHIFPHIEQGRIGLKSGPLMAQTTEFDIRLNGKTAHGAMPQEGIDTIVAAANLVNGLQTLISRRIDPMDNAVITIGKLMAGERRNILAERAILEGTIRTFDDNVYKKLKKHIIDMLEGLERSYDVVGEFKELTYYSVVDNDKMLIDKVKGLLNAENIVEAKPLMIAEDFSFFQREVPGIMMLLGSGNKKRGYIHPLHSNKFNFDNDILAMGLQTMVHIIAGI